MVKHKSSSVLLRITAGCSTALLLLSLGKVHADTGTMLSLERRKQIFSLMLQGAPMPQDLLQVETSEELPVALPPLTAEQRWTRAQAFLSSLRDNADAIATFSPHAAEDIHALAMKLLHESQGAQTAEERTAFFAHLEKTIAEIFPQSSTVSLPSFQKDMRILLTEIPDLLSLLRGQAGKNATDALGKETQRLEQSLDYLSDSEDVLLFMKECDAFAQSLLSLVPEAPLPLLKEDLEQLLGNLETYLMAVGQTDVHGEKERLLKFREEVSSAQTSEALESVVGHFEDLLIPTP